MSQHNPARKCPVSPTRLPLLVCAILAAALATGCANPPAGPANATSIAATTASMAPPAAANGTPAAASFSPGFYRWSQALPEKPGVLLQSEPLDRTASLGDAGQQLRILFTSTNGLTGKGTLATSGAVYFPKTPRPAGGWPVIAWAHGTTGIGDACAPSRMARTPRDTIYLNTWLSQGYVVVAPDYQGLGTEDSHLYLHARAQAYSMLDGVRAALTLNGVSNRVVIVGQSQGGGAAFGTAGYAPLYAPEVKVLGTVATGTPHLRNPNPSPVPPDMVLPPLAYAMYAAATAKVLNPALKDEELFTPAALPAMKKSANACVWEMFETMRTEGRTTANTMLPDGNAKMLRAAAAAVVYPTMKLGAPIFMGIGEADVDVSAAQQVLLAADACKAGTNVVKRTYPGLNHSETVNASLKDSLPFVRDLFAGKAVAGNCGT